MNTRLALAALALALVGPALGHPMPAATVRTGAGAYARLEPGELKAQLQRKDFVLVNVHVPYEGEIAGTDEFVPFDRVASAGGLPRDKGAEIVLYCRSGAMSAVAARALVGLGYRNVRELAGGFDAWRAAGYRLETRRR